MPPISQPDSIETRTIDYPASAEPPASIHLTFSGTGETMNFGSILKQKTGTLGYTKINDSNIAISGLTAGGKYMINVVWRSSSAIISNGYYSVTDSSSLKVYGDPSSGGLINQYDTCSTPANGGTTQQYTYWLKPTGTSFTLTTGGGSTGLVAFIVDIFIIPQ